jgi:hypothetical protein
MPRLARPEPMTAPGVYVHVGPITRTTAWVWAVVFPPYNGKSSVRFRHANSNQEGWYMDNPRWEHTINTLITEGTLRYVPVAHPDINTDYSYLLSKNLNANEDA